MYGVSPAYFISRFSDRFSTDQILGSLPDIKSAGFDSVQLEVFHNENLEAWSKPVCTSMKNRLFELELTAGPFAAHFLLHGFKNRQAVEKPVEWSDIQKVCSIAESTGSDSVIILPLPQFETEGIDFSNTQQISDLRKQAGGKLYAIAETLNARGFKTAVEVMPGSIFGSYSGLLSIIQQADPYLGINLDTGHSKAAKERVELLPAMYAGRIYATHLCDNSGNENRSDPPGTGTVKWHSLMYGLHAAGYSGSYDLEIICQPGSTTGSYKQGLQFIQELRGRTA